MNGRQKVGYAMEGLFVFALICGTLSPIGIFVSWAWYAVAIGIVIAVSIFIWVMVSLTNG